MAVIVYTVINVDPSAAETTEQMGSKEKFWYNDPELGPTLFKAARAQTGEDWAEKVAERLCDLLGLPHARYELAISGDRLGVVSPSFVAHPGEALVHGNELLAGYDAQFAIAAEEARGRTPQYTLPLVLSTIESSGAVTRNEWQTLPLEVTEPVHVFVGYLLHDAWVGNTDRHQQNWAIVVDNSDEEVERRFLAPQFDTASSLGRNEADERRAQRLTTRDPKQIVEYYADRAKSPFFLTPESGSRLSPIEAFHHAARLQPEAGKAWLSRLESVPWARVEEVLERLPETRTSSLARQFALRMLKHNRQRLLALTGTF